MNEKSSALVIELSKAFMQLLGRLQPRWEHGYFRFYADRDSYGACASYTHGDKVDLIDALAHHTFFDAMNASGMQLLESVGKQTGVFLLSVDKEYNYNIQFDYENPERWQITKLDGGTGIPEQ